MLSDGQEGWPARMYSKRGWKVLSFQHTFADLPLAISAVLLLNGDVAFSKAKWELWGRRNNDRVVPTWKANCSFYPSFQGTTWALKGFDLTRQTLADDTVGMTGFWLWTHQCPIKVMESNEFWVFPKTI